MSKKTPRNSEYFVYIVKCKNDTYYTGYTNNLEKRIGLHNKGKGAKYLRGKGPITLMFFKEYKYLKCALNEERRIKSLRRHEKEKLLKQYARKQKR